MGKYDRNPRRRLLAAIDAGQLSAAWQAVHEVPKVFLADALKLTMLMAADWPDRFPAAARRWLLLYVHRARPSLEEIADAAHWLGRLARDTADETPRQMLLELAGRMEERRL